MGFMNKIKNLFTEEVEEEVVEEEPIKKEVTKVEIPTPVVTRTAMKEKESGIDEKVEKLPEPEPIVEKDEDYKFPFFDDDDFSALDVADKKEKIEVKEEKRSVYQRKPHQETKKESYTSPVYNPIKEEKKAFKPTPIISPVYGILDKNYNKEDIKTKGTKLRSYYNPKEATVDEIRNKAYGTLEDDIETTLFGREPDESEDILIEEAMDNVELETPDVDIDETLKKQDTLDKPRHAPEDELADLLEEEMAKEEKVTREEKHKEEKPRKISDSELFDMIDSMYQKGDEE